MAACAHVGCAACERHTAAAAAAVFGAASAASCFVSHGSHLADQAIAGQGAEGGEERRGEHAHLQGVGARGPRRGEGSNTTHWRSPATAGTALPRPRALQSHINFGAGLGPAVVRQLTPARTGPQLGAQRAGRALPSPRLPVWSVQLRTRPHGWGRAEAKAPQGEVSPHQGSLTSNPCFPSHVFVHLPGCRRCFSSMQTLCVHTLRGAAVPKLLL